MNTKLFKNMSAEQILKTYFVKYGNYRVMKFYKHPSKWFVLDKTYFEQKKEWRMIHEPNQRQIMPDELVFDIDVESHDKKFENAGADLTNIIIGRLKNDNIKFSVWFSGGSGFHIHAFFPQLLKYNKIHRKLFKELLLKHYGYGYLNTHLPAHVCLAPKTLIQLENAMHRKLRGTKAYATEFNPNWDTSECFNNKIPQALIDKFERLKNKVRLIIKKPFLSDKEDPQCIRFILSNDFLGKKDGRKRALFILASYYKKRRMPDDQIIQRLIEWNNYELNNYLSVRSIKSTVKSSNGTVGCHYVRNFLDELNVDFCKTCKTRL